MKKSELSFLKGVHFSNGVLTSSEITKLFDYIKMLEALLDEDDKDDVHGTEGWRHHLDIEGKSNSTDG